MALLEELDSLSDVAFPDVKPIGGEVRQHQLERILGR
jgi:hypothetical protein